MGFEPTTPCLQIVQLVAVEPGDLVAPRRRVAWAGPAQTAGVAHLWPNTPARLVASGELKVVGIGDGSTTS